MKCIFCKHDASVSRSVEHIIPESLGNIENILPTGIVCDTCNNYFARKIEGPLLETPWFKHLRSRQWVKNKRGFVPPMLGTVPGARSLADVWLNGSQLTIQGRNEKEDKALIDAILSGRASRVFIPLISDIDDKLMSRFLAKISLEVLAQRLMIVDGWRDEITENSRLDDLRNYARKGDPRSFWPFSRRRLYGEDNVQHDGHETYQIIHEYNLMYIKSQHLYLIICIFGEEFAINLGEPEIENYTIWLRENRDQSPLYISENLPKLEFF